jgi:phage terminase large subunit-like protein
MSFLVESLLSLSVPDRVLAIQSLTEEKKKFLLHNWRTWARPKQLPPEGDWGTWMILAGRGFGKTRAGSGWVHERAMEYPGRWIALVAKTPADARDYMIEGPGGLLRNTPPDQRPKFEPSKRRLTWENGSWATVYSDEEPDQTRGYSGDTAWIDELAKFRNARETWDNLSFGMREASTDRPRRLVTTTPRPIPIIRELIKLPTTRTVVGTSHENRVNLDPTWYEETVLSYEGTRIGRQEVLAEILDDFPGALWTRTMLDDAKVPASGVGDLERVVVAIDPSGTKGEDNGDSVGIVVAGKGVDGFGYVLADRTCSLSPEGWGRRAVEAYHEFKADRIVAEKNFGGDMVRFVVQAADRNVAYEDVTASRGKVVRAEPIAALYEQERIKHAGLFPELEDQMAAFTRSGYMGDKSPDRVDALVWALSDLLLGEEKASMAMYL